MNLKNNKNFMIDNGVAHNYKVQDVMKMMMMMIMMIPSRLNMSIAVEYTLFVVKK
jgi:hypothetical protein